ncbi:creatininase family protein [Dissulfurirhabdus thermomarina]|uniref:Creatininase family protein n=2 Tax=Dissulfurirhabdus thermomarina TaxID=1765737 RepID=A0A6N9TNM3_DISTH|nr:creatininase family protein [Dissulfurirhabdus thermomarina]NDY42648.1 creatininase family protein [Dissulfurirhabdus thermomarina]
MEELTMEAFEAELRRTRTVIVPFGSVEEHGAHLPLGTDTLHVAELAAAAAKKRRALVAPPVWYGLCRSTRRHPGTLTLSFGTVRRLAVEIAGSLYAQGLRNFVLVSGHAGGTHMAALEDAGEEILSTLPESRVAVLSVLDLVAGLEDGLVETPGDSHAGEVETALMQHLRPALVHGTSPAEYPSFPRPLLVRDKRRYWPGGVWGDPSKASPEKGRRILEAEAEALAAVIERLEKTDPGSDL